jgi:soluble lytic murein transglycosylase-like protein
MSYADCVARISQLDAVVRGFDPNWLGIAGATAPTNSSSGSLFSGVLEGVAGTTNASATTAGSALPTLASLRGDMTSPLPGARKTQDFGATSEKLEPSATVNGVKYAHYHNGIDLAARLGTPVLAAATGTVVFAGKQSDGAVIVKIRHADGFTTLYGHLNPSLEVSVGDQVSAGQEIGKIGLTGVTTGPHLHFGLYNTAGKAVDPAPALAAGRLPGTVSAPSASSILPSWAMAPAVLASSGVTAADVNLPATLMGPAADDPNTLAPVNTAAALASFDASSSRIPYSAEIRSAAIAAGIDPSLLAGLVHAESNFHAYSVSRCGAKGLTQLMPKIAAALGVKDPLNAQENLNGGAKYLAKQLRNFNRVDKALAAYCAGPGAVHRLGAVPDSKKGYVAKILRTWSSYQVHAS